ncbi:MAG: ABC-F family ATP-binding cassette domain-containing protein, partial [Vicinamibacterales bacterium]|nr:ABC-F family ATP-binding cassette domain-containing protein [Vicinamibacterales bacterium]
MIQLSAISKRFGAHTLLERVTWQLGPGERVGLCGPNGAGKTTLLKIMVGAEQPDSGQLVTPNGLTVGYLPQDGLAHTGRTVFEEVSRGLQALLDLKAEMHTLEQRLADTSVPETEHKRLLERYAEAQDSFQRQDGYTIDQRVAAVLRGLGFADGDAHRPTETFSGGWQMRIALAKLLLGRPGLLLLDEPTNHLDLEARNWLESYLADYPHAVVLVSHDRYFLDAVVTRITEIGLRTLTDYPGTYSAYVVERDARLERLRAAKRRQDEEIARVRQFIDRFRYQATKAAQVQSRIKMLDKVVPIEVPPERKRVHFTFPKCRKSGRSVITLTGVRKAYGRNEVFRPFDLLIERGSRIALVGVNGSGKSTLMRLLAGAEAPDAGSRVEGHQVTMQYFAQDEATRLDPSLTVHETLAAGAPLDAVPMIRNVLGGFLFSGDDVHKPTRVLSGGERTRLAVARMLLRPANTLLLDEPTNHLDIDSTDVLLDALAAFDGTLIFVSHDRYFVDRLATQVIDVGRGKAVVYPGTYEEFRWSQSQQPAAGVAGARPTRRDPRRAARGASAADRNKDAAVTRKRQRAAEARQRRVEKLEQVIAEREAALKDLETRMSQPDFYADRNVATAATAQHQTLMWEIGELM